MNFFDAQEHARKTTRRLVVLYAIAVMLVVSGVSLIVGLTVRYSYGPAAYNYSFVQFITTEWPLLSGIALLSALFILGATLFKSARLAAGGGRVATDMGGTLVDSNTTDPLRRRLRNVVEEMAIASGVPVPEIYVLEQENSINAFAAGFSPGDAAIAVTRGTLELLDRDELQGVIAHEFSHVLNGDMRLNIRLMGVLFGIMALGMIGRMVLRGGRRATFVTRGRDRGGAVVLFIGLALAILGAVGVFIARMIKAGISRQREFLADASAVQFTRQKTGLANALKKIGGYSDGSHLSVADPEEVSHMLFGSGAKLSGLLATHPPLAERIQALDPSFKAGDYVSMDKDAKSRLRQAVGDDRSSGLASAVAGAAASVDAAASIVDRVGQPSGAHVEYASALRKAIPERLYEAAHSVEQAYLLAIALVLDQSGRSLEQQLNLAEEKLGRERAKTILRFHEDLSAGAAEFRLPLLEIAFPALRQRPNPQLEFLIELTGDMIAVDGETDLYEYCYYRILRTTLNQSIKPTGKTRRKKRSARTRRKAATVLLSLIARFGHDNDQQRAAAYRAGASLFGSWALGEPYSPTARYTVALLDQCLDVLDHLSSNGRGDLLKAVSAVVMFDDKITATEAELVRTISCSLNCPIPPIIGKSMAS